MIVNCKNRHEYTCDRCGHRWELCGMIWNGENRGWLDAACQSLACNGRGRITKCIGRTTCNNTGWYVKPEKVVGSV